MIKNQTLNKYILPYNINMHQVLFILLITLICIILVIFNNMPK